MKPFSSKADNNIEDCVVFYCKDCEKLVNAKPLGRKFVYRCNTCGTKNVAFGLEEAIRNFYRVKGDERSEVKAEMEKSPMGSVESMGGADISLEEKPKPSVD